MFRKIIATLTALCLLLTLSAAALAETVPVTSNTAVRDQLKSIDYWNENPTVNLPNPFELLDGTIVSTPEQWETRAAEIREMLQYYEYGYLPAPPDTLTYELGVQKYSALDWATWTFVEREIDGMKITMTVGDRTAEMKVGVQLPETPMPEGGYPALICLGSLAGSYTNTFLPRGYAVIGLDVGEIYNEQTGEGVVKTLFQFDWLNDPNAPSSMMGWAWGTSRLIDALEQGAYAGQINPEMLAITGFSRNGKGALVAGAFDERIAVVDPGNAGCGGTAIERFISPLLFPEYYIFTAGEATENSHIVLPGQENLIGVRKWTLSEGSADAWNEAEQRYVPRYQTLTHCREQQDLWFASRFQQFKQDESVICDPVDIHKWTTQQEFVNPLEWEDAYNGPGYGGQGTPFGVLYSIPFDQHFLMSLVAPRGLMIHSGYTDDWNNPEGMAFGYYVTRETFRYMDVLHGTENEYANRISLVMGDWGHAYPDYAANATVNFCNYIMQPEGEIYAEKATYTAYPYPDEDSRRAVDYDKLNWSAAQPEVKAEALTLPEDFTLKTGETSVIRATVTPDNATGLHAIGVAYTSSDPAIATIDEAGLVTAVGTGTVTIEASFQGLTAQCIITIE